MDQDDVLVSIMIKSLPSQGVLSLDGVAVTIDQVIVVADIPRLTLTPAEASADYVISFDYTVNDGTDDSDVATLTVDITADNYLPVFAARSGSSFTVDVQADDGVALRNSFTFIDPEHPLVRYRIQLEDGTSSGGIQTKEGDFGTFTFVVPGQIPGHTPIFRWLYEVDTDKPATLNLGQGETGTETFTLTYRGVSQVITINVQGVEPATIVDATAYTLAQDALPNDENVLDLSSASGPQLIQGGNKADTITASAHGDVVIGGYGSDDITLDDGADTVIYRISSNGNIWAGIDGTDTIHNFERGVDKLVLVDVDGNPLDLASFISEGSFYVVPSINADSITSVEIVFTSGGLPDGPGSGGNAIDGKIVINFKDSFVIENAGTTIDQGRLTDLSLLANYFGEGFDEGLQVITPDQLGVEVI